MNSLPRTLSSAQTFLMKALFPPLWMEEDSCALARTAF